MNIGRSTKLLLHPKNVPDLQFSSKTEERGKIPPEVETSEIQNTSNLQSNSKTGERGEISPKMEISAVQDILDLQFYSKTEEGIEILPEAEISVIQVVSKKIENIDLCGETSPQSHEVIKTPIIKTCNEYIVDCTEELTEHGEIPPKTATKEECDKLCEKRRWFQNPVNCVSKWSKALKMCVVHSIGLKQEHTATMDLGESDKPSFSFFL